MRIETFTLPQAEAALPQLIALLQDVVDGGASVGFLPPLSVQRAEQYWLGVLRGLAGGYRILLVANEDSKLIGAVQLELATKENALHRAEVQKLIVHNGYRRMGVGRALLSAVADAARAADRTLLVLDTERGSAAEELYERCGYTRAGIIPQFALTAGGTLIDTVVFFRSL